MNQDRVDAVAPQTNPLPPQKLIVFSDDWARHPSSSQHLVRALLNRHDVSWINTIGMRPPRLDLITVKRGWEKLTHWRPGGGKSGDSHQISAGDGAGDDAARRFRLATPRVTNPLMWPSFRWPWGRWLNRRLLTRAIEQAIATGPPSPRRSVTVMTTIPIVADLVGMPKVDRWVYYCVDDFSSWPGLDGKTLDKLETQLVSRVDAIVSAGDNLATRMQKLGRESELIYHGVDLELWEAAQRPELSAARLANLPRPIVLFWGLIDRRLDIQMVRALAERMTAGSIVFVGPQQDPDPQLFALPHVVATGPADFPDLPRYAAAADVLVMPYDDLPVTRAMQPLKLKEYLATGKPVVVRRLPATDDWADCLDSVTTPAEFVGAVERRLTSGLAADQQAARQRLRAEGWSAKALRLEEILFPPALVSRR